MGATNTELLNSKIEDSGLKLSFIAEQCKLSYPSLSNRLKGKVEFRANEIRIISSLLDLSSIDVNRIFFNSLDDKTTSR